MFNILMRNYRKIQIKSWFFQFQKTYKNQSFFWLYEFDQTVKRNDETTLDYCKYLTINNIN